HGNILRGPRQMSRVQAVLNESHWAKPKSMARTLRIIERVDVRVPAWVAVGATWPGYLHSNTTRRTATGKVATEAARWIGWVFDIVKWGSPDAERKVDVLFPEPLIGIGDRAVQLGMVISAGGNVGRDLVVIQDVAGPKDRRKWVGTGVLDPVENGRVVDHVVAGRVVKNAVRCV